jgi:hypothetical protein
MPDLFTLYELASYLQQDLDTATADQARTTATNYLRRELGVEFDEAPRTLTEVAPPTADYRQLRGPLTSIESVTVNGTELADGEDYYRTNRGIACPAGFGDKVGTWAWVDLVVTYTAGFAAIPEDLHDAGLFLAGLSYLRGTRPGVTGSTISVEGVSESLTYAAGDPDAAGAAIALDEGTLRDLRRAYGSGRPLAGSARIR